MKGMGDFMGHEPRDEFFDDDLTRRGPIPLTIKRAPAKTPTAIDVDFPIVASVDVDLGTPAPVPFQPSGHRPSASRATATPPTTSRAPSRGEIVMHPNPRLPSPSRSYPIRPTPTFSFTEPELWQPPTTSRVRTRSGPGFVSITLLMLVAGLAGYLTVKYRAWQDLGPLVARATELARSLRTLAPSSSPEVSAPAATTTPTTSPAPAAAPTGASIPPTAAVPEVAAAPQALRPEVVPIAPPNAKPVAPKPAAASVERVHRYSPKRRHQPLQPLSAEAAAEEALLSAPLQRR